MDALKKLRPKSEDRYRHQIVQTAPGHVVKQAAPDSFLSEKNQTVDRQTVSNRHMTEMGAKPQAVPQTLKKTQSSNETSEVARDAVKAPPVLSQLGVPILPAPTQAREAVSPAQDARWAHFGALPQDYVRGFKESDQTLLNTKEYVFYGYFQRIRERLDRAWVPILRQQLTKLWRTGRQLASDMDHTTEVLVVLNHAGEIVRVHVVNESGTRDLDDAAVRAFNEAGPFPNPPHGIVDLKGEIEIPWQFILKT